MAAELETKPQQSNFSKFEWLISQAVTQHKSDNNIEAVELYLLAIDSNEDSPTWVYGNVIILLAQLERLDEANLLCEKSIKLYPESDEIARARGVVYEKQNQPKLSLSSYQRAIELHFEQPEWVYSKVTRYLILQKQILQGVETAQKGLELYPQSYWLKHYYDKWYDSSSALLLKENIQHSLDKLETYYYNRIENNNYDQKLLDDILSNHIHKTNFLARVADLLCSKKQCKQAVNFYKQAIELRPKQVSLFVKLGDAYYYNDEIENASETYNQALAIEPQNEQANFQLINILIRQDREEEAAQKAFELGEFLIQENRLEQAIKVYEKIVEVQPDNNSAYHMLGDIYCKLKKVEKAIAAYHYAIALKPDFAPTYHNLGDIFFQQSQWKRATSAYRHSTRIDANCPWSYPRLGDCLANQGNIEEASDCYYKAIKLGWSN